jgi:hypothetical protein
MEMTFRCMLAVVSGNVDGSIFLCRAAKSVLSQEHLAVADTMEWT